MIQNTIFNRQFTQNCFTFLKIKSSFCAPQKKESHVALERRGWVHGRISFFDWTVPLKQKQKKAAAIPSNEFWFFLFLNYRLSLWRHVAFIPLSEACRDLRLLHICATINVLHKTTGTDQKTNKSTDPGPALLSLSNIVWPRQLDLGKLAVHFWAKPVATEKTEQK